MTWWPLTPRLRTLLPAVAGFVAYGGWAYVANMGHGSAAAGTAALVQGSYSFALTLSTTLIMERLFQRFAGYPRPVSMVVGITCAGLFATAYSINWFAGTPEILATILPGFVIGSLFTLAYVRHLATVNAGADEMLKSEP